MPTPDHNAALDKLETPPRTKKPPTSRGLRGSVLRVISPQMNFPGLGDREHHRIPAEAIIEPQECGDNRLSALAIARAAGRAVQFFDLRSGELNPLSGSPSDFNRSARVPVEPIMGDCNFHDRFSSFVCRSVPPSRFGVNPRWDESFRTHGFWEAYSSGKPSPCFKTLAGLRKLVEGDK